MIAILRKGRTSFTVYRIALCRVLKSLKTSLPYDILLSICPKDLWFE